MKELELMTSEEYWDMAIEAALYRETSSIGSGKDLLKYRITKLIKLLKDEIPDYSTRFTH